MNTLLAERVLPGARTIQLVQGDLTTETSGAIVNAANAHLHHGAGVAGAIVSRGGPVIQQESDAWVRDHGPVSHGRPAWTSGGLLPARYIIHAVGPVWGDGGEDAKLGEAIQGSLELADELRLDSISFPAISTGIFGFPRERAAGVIFRALRYYFARTESGIKLVRIVVLDQATISAFMSVWEQWA